MEELSKINPFDWEEAFREIFENGGFDAVIGNPPWGAEFIRFRTILFKRKKQENC